MPARPPSTAPRSDSPASPSRLRPDSLAFSLNGAAHAVALVKQGSALPQALARIFAKTAAAAPARGAIQDIAYRTMRQRGRVDALIALLASKAPEPAPLYGLLACALTLVVDPADKSYEAFTVVDQAVTAAASDAEIAHAKGMVNAVLRRFLRERDALLAAVAENPQAIWNFPGWWIDATRSAHPQHWQAILAAGNSAPPLTLRVNQRKTSTDDYLRLLETSQIAATRIGPHAVRLAQPVQVSAIPGFADGLVSVQDAAAQLAGPLLALRDGMRVLDACAAPGGKTGQILESAAVTLTALDSDASRLPRIEQNLQRLQLQATLVQGDASKQDWWDGQLFDRVLADVPCTASGIVRRHPDIRWLRRRADATQLAILSAQILDNLWQMVKPGGKLLFVTCSVWPQESEGQAAAFAVRQKATRLPAPGQLLPTAAAGEDHDGLFYALFEKPAV
ncbi:MAG: 16S rRNA (cytosine(967)-C(5))-methyltransferase RsmB [Janthinobacterium lividum]